MELFLFEELFPMEVYVFPLDYTAHLLTGGFSVFSLYVLYMVRRAVTVLTRRCAHLSLSHSYLEFSWFSTLSTGSQL